MSRHGKFRSAPQDAPGSASAGQLGARSRSARAKGLQVALSPDCVFVAADAASSKTADPTVVLDVGDLLGITDHFVITSGSNVRQVRTIAEEIEQRVKEQGGGPPRYVEGLDDARWVLLDYGEFVVHVFLDEARRYYDLERLWADAPRVDQSGPGGASRRGGVLGHCGAANHRASSPGLTPEGIRRSRRAEAPL